MTTDEAANKGAAKRAAGPVAQDGQSGQQFIDQTLAGLRPGSALARLLNIRLVAAGAGTARFLGTPGPEHTNYFGALHGGWYGTLLDSTLGTAVMSLVPQGRWYTTLEYKVNLTRALPLGVEVECTARVSHFGRSTATAEGAIRGVADGRLYAAGSTTCLILGG